MGDRRLEITVPEQVVGALGLGDADLGPELLMAAAAKLHELGRLSSGLAADLAGIPRTQFLIDLGRHRVFPLESELRDLESTTP